MKKTRLCDLLGIEHPIIQAPMAWIAGAELAAAVSRAGGLGTIAPGAGQSEVSYDPEVVGEALRGEIRKAKALTSKPFAVNLPIGRRGKAVCDRRVEIAREEGVEIAIVSMGSPEEYTEQLKRAGIKVLHAISTVRQAVKAEEAGVDAVVAEGYEAGGHTGLDELTTMVLVPQVVDAVEIPVIAGGGVGDVRGVVAALALGAEGVYMGTRFIATHECTAHPKVKQAIVEAIDTSTVAYGRRTYSISRALKNEFAEKFLEMEFSGVTPDTLRDFDRFIAPGDTRQRAIVALREGDLVQGSVLCGAVAGLVKEIVSAEEVVRHLVKGYEKALARLD